MVGYRGQLDFKLPEDYKGYAKVELNLALSNLSIIKLINRAASIKFLSEFKETPETYY